MTSSILLHQRNDNFVYICLLVMRRSSSSKSSKRKRQQSFDDSNSEIQSKKHRTDSSSKSRRISSRHRLLAISQFNEITSPDWDSICPNIDQILSNKHSQSGVYAHEVHLVQQELEALLSLAIVRENFLHSTSEDNRRANILQHKEAENIYSSKKTPAKPLPPLVPICHQRQNGPQVLLDRQVAITPVVGTRLDKTWTDLDTYYRKISSNDILMIENLLKFDRIFEDKLRQYKYEYQTQLSTESTIKNQLNEENFHQLFDMSQSNSLTTHYLNRTTLGRLQNHFSERLSHLSPVYKTPRSNLPRISPRLHGPTFDQFLNVAERLRFVRDALADQHPIVPMEKSKRKRKHSVSISSDDFDSKLSTLLTLVHECSVINQGALSRARLQSTNEQTWQKLQTIEHDLETLIEKFESTGDEKLFQKLEHLLRDWKKYEDDYNHQLEQLE